MRWIDTHAHLDFSVFDHDRETILQELATQGIGVLNPATDEASIVEIDKLTRRSPMLWGALGLHPTDITVELIGRFSELLKHWNELLNANPRLVAIGEIGLDYYHKNDSAHHQKAALRQMLTFAVERNLPVIFHCRDAYGDLVTLLGDYPKVRGVIHCFSGTLSQAEQFLDLGLHLSFTCNVTYEKNESLREIIRQIPFDRLMIETDSPFLSSSSRRGLRNDPTQVVKVAEVIAQQKGVPLDEVARQTTATAQKLFNIKE
jgi:TatD DNase family protein